ncbi:MAG: HAMP domain-containing protein [Planctomycetes bacterium]|nr:HAMP domain-containing protein [Planctomycetota bacterium]
MLQDVLADIDAANADAAVLIDGTLDATAAAVAIEHTLASGTSGPVERGAVEAMTVSLEKTLDRLAAHHAASDPASPAGSALAHARLLAHKLVGSQPTASDVAGMHAALQDLGRLLRGHVAAEQVQVGRYFRGLVLGLTVAATLIMNVAILVLLHTAQMVLRPVSQLVEGSRLLAAEHFDHRVNVDQQDEFGELARAYNHLASQLQSSEERKAETLRQLAVTLNHGLNNAMSIIELQLGLLDRQAGGNPALASHLREIRGSLTRMTDIVSSLKQIRRVVLTDYLPGQKMVDLERSVELEPPQQPAKST